MPVEVSHEDNLIISVGQDVLTHKREQREPIKVEPFKLVGYVLEVGLRGTEPPGPCTIFLPLHLIIRGMNATVAGAEVEPRSHKRRHQRFERAPVPKKFAQRGAVKSCV